MRAHLGPWMGFDLRELEFCVVWVHLSDLFPCRGSQHLSTDAAAVWANILTENMIYLTSFLTAVWIFYSNGAHILFLRGIYYVGTPAVTSQKRSFNHTPPALRGTASDNKTFAYLADSWLHWTDYFGLLICKWTMKPLVHRHKLGSGCTFKTLHLTAQQRPERHD